MATEVNNNRTVVSSQIGNKDLPVDKPQNSSGETEVENSAELKQVDQKTAPLATEQSVPPERIKQAVQELNNQFQSIKRELKFDIQEDIGKTIITVVDEDSQEVIRQIPPDEVVRLAQILNDIMENQSGTPDSINGLILEIKA